MENEKLKCDVEYYTLHKHFYGNDCAKFSKNAYLKAKKV
jgi:hypothetical protein